jgi:hypothetical protein
MLQVIPILDPTLEVGYVKNYKEQVHSKTTCSKTFKACLRKLNVWYATTS